MTDLDNLASGDGRMSQVKDTHPHHCPFRATEARALCASSCGLNQCDGKTDALIEALLMAHVGCVLSEGMSWEPTRWWRVTAPDGSIWCETSSESEARDATRPGDTLSRLFQRTEHEWRPIPPAWDDDPNHPEGVDCHGEPLSSGERCGRSEHRVFSPGQQEG